MKTKKLLILLLLGILIYFFCYWQNNDVVVSSYIYANNKINASIDGYKIAQISDLHNKKFGKSQKGLLYILKKANPNIIVITGDIVDSRHTNIDTALEFVEGAVKIAPVYYVTGNHEYRLANDEWNKLMQGLEQYGVIILDNEFINVEYKNENFYLIGLNDLNLSNNTLKTLCSDLDINKIKIVLAHEPQYFDNYKDSKVDLVLAGHAHGGQFRLPFIGALIAPNQGLFPKYTSGPYSKDRTTMIVSRGLGNSIIPVRIFNRPEVVIITIKFQY